MTSKINYNGQLRTTATHLQSGETIITDAPIDNKGKGSAFSPTDLFATSLASCMITIIGINAEERGYSIEGAKAEVTKIMIDNPRRVGEIKVKLIFSGSYSEIEKKRIETSAYSCPVSKSLNSEIVQTIEFIYGPDY